MVPLSKPAPKSTVNINVNVLRIHNPVSPLLFLQPSSPTNIIFKTSHFSLDFDNLPRYRVEMATTNSLSETSFGLFPSETHFGSAGFWVLSTIYPRRNRMGTFLVEKEESQRC